MKSKWILVGQGFNLIWIKFWIEKNKNKSFESKIKKNKVLNRREIEMFSSFQSCKIKKVPKNSIKSFREVYLRCVAPKIVSSYFQIIPSTFISQKYVVCYLSGNKQLQNVWEYVLFQLFEEFRNMWEIFLYYKNEKNFKVDR